MGKDKLSGQERVQRMFSRRDHDRVPRHESFWPETITRWQSEGLCGDESTVRRQLGSDFHGLSWISPKCFPGSEEVLGATAETRDVRDEHGKIVRYWKNKSGTPEHLSFGCDTHDKWQTLYKPALLSAGLQVDPEAVRRHYASGREKALWCHLTGVESFEQTRALMGDEITMMAMADSPEWIADVSRTFTSVMLRNLDACMASGVQPDGLWIYGDMAFNHATMCSPAMYRELIWPDHKRLADWAHAHEMKFIYHTDGDVNGVLDLYLEAGFDCLQPLECKAHMDIRKIGPRYGKRLGLFGNIDVMVMGTNDREKIEREVRSKLAAGMATRGYAYHSDHSVPPTMSWQSYQWIIELLDRYGSYE